MLPNGSTSGLFSKDMFSKMAFLLMLQGFRRFEMSEIFQKIDRRQNFFVDATRNTMGEKAQIQGDILEVFLSLTFLIGVWDKI